MSVPNRATVLITLALFAGACGNGGHQTATTTTSLSDSRSATTATSPAARAQQVSVTPSSGLRDHQVVHVVATGFTPGAEGVGVVECEDKGARVGQNDCNIGGIVLVPVNAAGTVTTDFAVTVGPFGANGTVCRGRQGCIVAVTQLTLDPTEYASQPIAFR